MPVSTIPYRQAPRGRNDSRTDGRPVPPQQQQRRFKSGGSDYWHKGGNNQNPIAGNVDRNIGKRNDENAGTSTHAPQQQQQQQQPQYQQEKKQPFYPRNERWQVRNPTNTGNNNNSGNAQRGPLPDWDEVAEAAGNAEAFDYMNLMETQYSQLCAMMAIPPFDPSVAAKGTPIPGYMVPFIPQGAAPWQFRAPVVVPARPPLASLKTGGVTSHPGLQAAATAAQAALDKRMKTQSIQNSPPPSNHQHNSDSRPESVASSLTSTVPATPTNLLSPNIQPVPISVAAQIPIMQGPPVLSPFFAPFPGNVQTLPVMPELRSDNIKDILCKQIEYYFSVDNLQKDFFLRRRMDKQGYLPLSFISSFPRVRKVTTDLNTIAIALIDSDKVELDNEKMLVRTRINPESWPMDLPLQYSGDENQPSSPISEIPAAEPTKKPVNVIKPAEVAKPSSSTLAEKIARSTREKHVVKEVKVSKNVPKPVSTKEPTPPVEKSSIVGSPSPSTGSSSGASSLKTDADSVITKDDKEIVHKTEDGLVKKPKNEEEVWQEVGPKKKKKKPQRENRGSRHRVNRNDDGFYHRSRPTKNTTAEVDAESASKESHPISNNQSSEASSESNGADNVPSVWAKKAMERAAAAASSP